MPAPVQIDPTNGGEFSQQYQNSTQGPFPAGGALYALLSTATQLEISRSADGGNTWLLEDQGSAPTSANLSGGTCWFDGAHTIWVCYSESGAGPAPILVATFDTTTNTWTTGVGSGPSVSNVSACILRTDGTLFIASEAASVTSQLRYDIFNTVSSTFTAHGDLGVNITALPEYSANVTAGSPVFAGDAGLHSAATNIFFGYMSSDTSAPPLMNNGVFFAGFNLADTVFNFFVVPNQIGSPQPSPQALRCDNGPFMGPPAICGAANIVFGVAENLPSNDNYASIYVSTNSGATWTLDNAATGIDPGVTPGVTDRAQFAPMSFWDGTHLYCVYAQLPGPPSFTFPSTAIRLTVTTPNFAANPNTWVWNAQTAVTISQVPGMTPGTNGFSFPKFTIQGAALLSTDISGAGLTAWFVPFALPQGGTSVGTFVGFIRAGQFGGGNL